MLGDSIETFQFYAYSTFYPNTCFLDTVHFHPSAEAGIT
jgi:hypothetical protein